MLPIDNNYFLLRQSKIWRSAGCLGHEEKSCQNTTKGKQVQGRKVTV